MSQNTYRKHCLFICALFAILCCTEKVYCFSSEKQGSIIYASDLQLSGAIAKTNQNDSFEKQSILSYLFDFDNQFAAANDIFSFSNNASSPAVAISGRIKTVNNSDLPENLTNGGTGITVSISCTNGFSSSVVTRGEYTFFNVPSNAGSCTITPSTGSTTGGGVSLWSPTSRSVTNLTINASDNDFTAVRPAFNVTGTLLNYTLNNYEVRVNYSINNDTVTAPINCLVSIGGPNSHTYSCGDLSIYGSYTITPSHLTYGFTPLSRSYQTVVSTHSNQNFAAIACDTSISLGQTIEGSLSSSDCGSPSNPYDVYTFNGTAGQRIKITMDSAVFVTQLELFDTNNTLVRSTPLGNTRASNLFFTVPATSTYIVRAKSRNDSNASGSYTISLINDGNCVTAPASISTGQSINASLANTDCLDDSRYYDDYTFNGNAGQSIVITMASSEFSDSSLQLFNSRGQLVASNIGLGQYGAARIVFTIPVTGENYLIRISSAALQGAVYLNPTGSYTISLSNHTSCTTSPSAIGFGQTTNGSLSTTDCVADRFSSTVYYDDYTFAGTAGQGISITMGSTTFVSRLELYNSSNQLISPASAISSNTIGSGANSRINYMLPANGTYRIRATSLYFNQIGTYIITLLNDPTVCQDGQCPPLTEVSGKVTVSNGRLLTNVPIGTSNKTVFSELKQNEDGSTFSGYNIALQQSLNHTVAPKLSTHASAPASYSFNPLGGTAQINRDFNLTLINDNFANAVSLVGEFGEIFGNNQDAGRQTGEPVHVGVIGGTSVWYKWRAPRSGQFTFTLGGSTFDTLLAIYTGTNVTSLTPVVSNDNIPGVAVFSRVTFTAVANTDYWIAVDGRAGLSGSGYFRMIYHPAENNVSGFVVSGLVKRSAQSGPLPGATILLQDLNGVIKTTAVAGIDGAYSIVIPQGINSFKITAFDHIRSEFTILSNITQNQTYNFFLRGFADLTLAVSGSIGNLDNIEGLSISATGANIDNSIDCPIIQFHDGSFGYRCSGLFPNGTYTITPDQPGSSFSPTSTSIVLQERNVENISFVKNSSTGFMIRGKVTRDNVALNGVKVSTTVQGAIVESITDSNGNYALGLLPAGGDYGVSAFLPEYSFTPSGNSFFLNLQSNQTLNFAASSNCSYIISPLQQTVPSAGGFYSIDISTSTGCSWEAKTNSFGFTVTTPLSYGSGIAYYHVEANTATTSRTGIITVAGQRVTVTQDAAMQQGSITGTISYGIIPTGQTVAKAVPDTILNVTGSPQVNPGVTDNTGRYNLSGFGTGEYTVKPEKTGYLIGTNAGISSFDATLILRCVAAGTNNCTLSTNQNLAADTNSNNVVTSFDATLVLRYVAAGGQTNATNNVGNWKFFDPVTRLDKRTYQSVTTPLENQNFEAVLVGDVNGSWMPPQSSFTEEAETEQSEIQSADKIPLLKAEDRSVVISAPETTVISEAELFNQANQTTEETSSLKEEQTEETATAEIELSIPENISLEKDSIVTVPILLTNKANKQISSFSFAVQFDSDVLQMEETAVDVTNSLSQNGFVILSDTNQRGRIGIAASAFNHEITESGTLLYLRLRVVNSIKESKGKTMTTALSFETIKSIKRINSLFEDEFGNRISSNTTNGSLFIAFNPND